MENTHENDQQKTNDQLEGSAPLATNEVSEAYKKKFSFKILLKTIRQTAIRFIFPLVFIAGVVILIFITTNRKDIIIDELYWIFFGLGIPMSLAVSLFAETLKVKFLRLGLNLIAAAVLGIYILLLPENCLSVDFYQTIILGLAFTIGVFVVSFYRKNNDNAFWEFGKTTILQLIISIVFATVLMLGLNLAAFSLQELFNINISSKVYANLALVCYGLFQPIYFLSNIPSENEKKNQTYRYDKFLKILGLYLLLPILAIYTIILYVYLIQIIAIWKLPNGWVTWLVSVLALGGFSTLLIQYPLWAEQNKTARLFAKFFPIILFPLLVLMTVGISRRFNDYGLTINRALVFLLNFWLYGVSVYLFLSRSKHLKYILISFSCIAFLSVVGPWSVLKITKYSMHQELVSLLTKNNYLTNSKVVNIDLASKITINKEDFTALNTKIDYLFDNYGYGAIEALFEDDFKAKNSYDVLKRLCLNDPKQHFGMDDFTYFNAFIAVENYSFDITSFTHMIKFEIQNDKLMYNDSLFRIDYKNEQLSITKIKDPSTTNTIKLISKIEALSKKKKSDFTSQEMSVESSNYKMLIRHINAELSKFDETGKIIQLEGLLFLK